MKHLIRKSSIAIAVAFALSSSAVWAASDGSTSISTVSSNSSSDPTNSSISTYNDTSVSLYKDVNVHKDLNLTGDVAIVGKILVNSNAMAIVDNKQLNYNNYVDMPDPAFTATTGDISTNSGNLGVNVTAGENNQQDNAAAIATADASFVLGSTDAEVFVQQSVWNNQQYISGATLNAETNVNANTGNVGVNVSAGVSNLQKNNLAISTGTSGLAEASSATLQETTGISTMLTADILPGGPVPVTYTSTLVGVAGNTGNTGVNLATGTNNLQANSLAISAVF